MVVCQVQLPLFHLLRMSVVSGITPTNGNPSMSVISSRGSISPFSTRSVHNKNPSKFRIFSPKPASTQEFEALAHLDCIVSPTVTVAQVDGLAMPATICCYDRVNNTALDRALLTDLKKKTKTEYLLMNPTILSLSRTEESSGLEQMTA